MDFILTLLLDIIASWARLFAALFLSIIFSIFVGISAATGKRAEKIILPVIDVLQTVPILAFFPVVIIVFVALFGPNLVGIDLSVVFLIFTSMSWNITFGVYEAVKAIPTDMMELARINRLTKWEMLRDIYVPAAMPRIAYQSMISWSIGLFYLVASEIFSTGSKNFAVQYGIGAEIAKLVLSQNTMGYIVAVLFLLGAILLTRILFLSPLSLYSERFSFSEEQKSEKKSKVLSFYYKIGHAVKKIVPKFEVGARSGVQGFVSETETKYEKRSGRNYSVPAFIAIVLVLFAVVVIATNSYSYLPIIADALTLSFARVWLMYLLCVAITIPLGIKIARSTKAYEPVLATLQVVAAVPAPILLPALIVVLQLLPFSNELVALAVIFVSMVWYMLFSVVSGMRTIPEQFNQIVKIFHIKWPSAWKNIYIPTVLPDFVTGSITAIGGAWNALIIAEYFSVEAGGGKSIVLAQVGNGVGKLLDIATFQANWVEMGLTLAAMVIMVVLINKFVWQRIYKKVTLKYRIEL